MDLKDMQKFVAEFDVKKNWGKDTPLEITLHMAEELGELSRVINRLSGYKPGEFKKSDVAAELLDQLYLVLKLANAYDIELDKEWGKIEFLYKDKQKRI
ncbi:MAG: MazG-like family protein [Candidatus Altiarchaeota archaeon]